MHAVNSRKAYTEVITYDYNLFHLRYIIDSREAVINHVIMIEQRHFTYYSLKIVHYKRDRRVYSKASLGNNRWTS